MASTVDTSKPLPLSITFLKALIETLTTRAPFKLESTPECRRRASVAAVFRLKPGRCSSVNPAAPLFCDSDQPTLDSKHPNHADLLAQDRRRCHDVLRKLDKMVSSDEWHQSPSSIEPQLELLLIRRATNPRDHWSAHMAFPGGKVEPKETDRHAAERETLEEIGLDLRSRSFVYLGELDDRDVKRPGTSQRWMALSCHVYVQVVVETPPVTICLEEVDQVCWIPVSLLVHPPDRAWKPVRFGVSRFVLGRKPQQNLGRSSKLYLGMWTMLAQLMDLLWGEYAYHGISVPGAPLDAFPIWGMTLWMISDLVSLATHRNVVPASIKNDRIDRSVLAVRAVPIYSAVDIHYMLIALTGGMYPHRVFVDDNLRYMRNENMDQRTWAQRIQSVAPAFDMQTSIRIAMVASIVLRWILIRRLWSGAAQFVRWIRSSL